MWHVVTKYRRLSMAGRKPRISPEFHWWLSDVISLITVWIRTWQAPPWPLWKQAWVSTILNPHRTQSSSHLSRLITVVVTSWRASGSWLPGNERHAAWPIENACGFVCAWFCCEYISSCNPLYFKVASLVLKQLYEYIINPTPVNQPWMAWVNWQPSSVTKAEQNKVDIVCIHGLYSKTYMTHSMP